MAAPAAAQENPYTKLPYEKLQEIRSAVLKEKEMAEEAFIAASTSGSANGMSLDQIVAAEAQRTRELKFIEDALSEATVRTLLKMPPQGQHGSVITSTENTTQLSAIATGPLHAKAPSEEELSNGALPSNIQEQLRFVMCNFTSLTEVQVSHGGSTDMDKLRRYEGSEGIACSAPGAPALA